VSLPKTEAMAPPNAFDSSAVVTAALSRNRQLLTTVSPLNAKIAPPF